MKKQRIQPRSNRANWPQTEFTSAIVTSSKIRMKFSPSGRLMTCLRITVADRISNAPTVSAHTTNGLYFFRIHCGARRLLDCAEYRFQHDEKMGPFPGTIEKCPFSALLRFLCRQNHWNAESLFRSVQDSSVQLDRTASGPALML